jgi:hypothetical protein
VFISGCGKAWNTQLNVADGIAGVRVGVLSGPDVAEIIGPPGLIVVGAGAGVVAGMEWAPAKLHAVSPSAPAATNSAAKPT